MAWMDENSGMQPVIHVPGCLTKGYHLDSRFPNPRLYLLKSKTVGTWSL